MTEIRFTLVADGTSDRALLPILKWLLDDQGFKGPIDGFQADFRRLRRPPKRLGDRLKKAIDLFPCDILFVHRDAEGRNPCDRRREIEQARESLTSRPGIVMPPCLCVIPVRMTGAWLLFDEAAIRRAAGNPNGKIRLDLPKISGVEDLHLGRRGPPRPEGDPERRLDSGERVIGMTAEGLRRIEGEESGRGRDPGFPASSWTACFPVFERGCERMVEADQATPMKNDHPMRRSLDWVGPKPSTI